MEVGGYFEFPQYEGDILHGDALALNSARNCLAYLIEARKIKKILLPKFLCASVEEICKKNKVEVQYYSIGYDFMPYNIINEDDAWIYMVNYYGQLNKEQITKVKEKYGRLILDNVQAYFQSPVNEVDTIYSCRKYFGVPDGAFLYTDAQLDRQLERDKSYNRMAHILGRYENSASEFYSVFTENENRFDDLSLRKMSKLTENLLRSINYKQVKRIRERNYAYLEEHLSSVNKIKLRFPEGSFMYPLYVVDGPRIREKLKEAKIYVATLWPDVFNSCKEREIEYDMAKNILPIPCDQRYDLGEMKYIVEKILKYVR